MIKQKDWGGNIKTTWVTLAATNHSDTQREEFDYYATEPRAVEIWLNERKPQLTQTILEPSAGEGHMAEVLKSHGYNVICKDIVQRSYPLDGLWDFLKVEEHNPYSIVMNPPYKYALEFIEKAIEISDPGTDIWVFSKLQFLEGKERRKRLYDAQYLKEVDVYTGRVNCAKNGLIEKYKTSAVCYSFMRFNSIQSGDPPIIKWIN